jgi:L-ascorbate metabolism protein UlaG (beta-lactamase superfamily)
MKRYSGVLVLMAAVAGVLLAQQGPRLAFIQQTTNGEAVLQLAGESGRQYRIDNSSNLLTWNPQVTFAGSASGQQTDSAAPYHLSRFYRAVELSGTTNLTGDHLITDNGEVTLHPINHATFIMTWNGKTLYNDPVGAASVFTGLPRADLILVSHSHSDHFSASTLESVRNSNTVIIAPQAVFNTMSTALKSVTIVLANGARTNLLGIAIEAVPAYNLTSSNHPRGVGNGYVVTIGGKRIYMSGDTEDIPEMRALPDIDVAFVCMNIPFTMSVDKAVSAVRDFRPKVIYPYHYRNSDQSMADLNSFRRQVGTALGVEVRLRKWY